MTTKTNNEGWEIEYAKRSLEGMAEDAKAEIRRKIGWIRQNLDEAERRLDAGEMPNTCGILQSAAPELEMALARYAAMRDARPAIAILLNAAAKEAK